MSFGLSVLEGRVGRIGRPSLGVVEEAVDGLSETRRSANAFSRLSPPPVEAQNFMYRSTILL